MTSLINVPLEVIVEHITTHIEIADIISLRRVCKLFTKLPTLGIYLRYYRKLHLLQFIPALRVISNFIKHNVYTAPTEFTSIRFITKYGSVFFGNYKLEDGIVYADGGEDTIQVSEGEMVSFETFPDDSTIRLIWRYRDFSNLNSGTFLIPPTKS